MQTASTPLESTTPAANLGDNKPVVIIGNGPAGMRVAQELLERLPDVPIVIYGMEPHLPYNRVRLSSWLAGDVDLEGLAQPLRPPFGAKIEERIGYRIVEIDPMAMLVVDNEGTEQPYRQLVLATGSTAFVPSIKGIELSGVFTFRDLDDTNRLIARRARSHHTVVLGGGLLGLEAARGMLRNGTRVTVIDHADRLLPLQIDEEASALLAKDVAELGIETKLQNSVTEIVGAHRVEGVRLRSGEYLPCDTLVLATGIRPNIWLAQQTKLHFRRGIKVDDQMRTSEPNIFAVGECCEHRDQVYGLVAPGLEQASVAAAAIADTAGHYTGTVAASRLKVVGTDVFSMGPMGVDAPRNYGRLYTYQDENEGIYRKILVHRYHLEGAIGIGPWQETVRLQSAISTQQKLWPWQIMRFLRTGTLWPVEDTQGVANWPAGSIVCQCTGATRGAISESIMLGACCAEDVTKATGASSVCGSCKPLVQELLGTAEPTPAVGWFKTLLSVSAIALLATLLMLILPAVPYASSVQSWWQPDLLWRDGLIKQISGFTILGVFAVGLVISLRKRVKWLSKLGGFDSWRMVHVSLGLLALIALLTHTGGRSGYGLNFALMTSFAAMLVLGAIASLVVAFQHRIDGARATQLRRRSTLLHILLFWPVPILLGWHVLKSYWF